MTKKTHNMQVVNIKKERNGTLDVLKGICILFVVITHFSWDAKMRKMLLFPFWIDMAVPIFMFISGYVSNLSFQKKNISFSEAYSAKNICSKFIRYTLPFLIVFIVQQIVFVMLGESIAWRNLIIKFMQGGTGPGSYYYPIMIQFIFVFPMIYWIIRRYKFKGLIICGVVNLIFEIAKNAYLMNSDCYRLLIFRYIFIIAAGCFFSNDTCNLKAWKPICTLIGMLYIILVSYTSHTPIIFTYWTGTSMIAAMFIVPITASVISKKWRIPIFEIMGRASYNIYLVQMLYFSFYGRTFFGQITPSALKLVVSVLVCTVVGVVFYCIEDPITRKIIKLFNNKYKKIQE